MLTTLVWPLAVAAMFTAGAFVIHRGQRYASQIPVVLSAATTGLFVLTMFGGLIQIGDRAAGRPTARPPGLAPATNVARRSQPPAPTRGSGT